MTSDFLTAITVAYDSAGVLPACLAALRAQGVATIVVDNASEDNTLAVAEAHGARVICNARNEGFGRANNAGVAAAETEFVLLINPDLVLQEGAVAALMAAAEAYPDAGMYAPRIIEPDGRFFFQNRCLLMESVVRRPVAGDARAMMPEGDCCAPFLSGACLMMRTETFKKLGGFDPEIFLFYEDDDLCRRVFDAGLALVHVQDALAVHARGQSSAPQPGRHYRARWHMAWSRVFIARKYGLPHGAWSTLAKNGPKYLLARLTRNRKSMERYGGTIDGTMAALREMSAIRKEGLV